ncbi:MAG: MazG-like family protein [Burkholderiales bacterium]
MHQTMNVASNAKLIEVLKAEFIGEASDVIRAALSPNGRTEMLDTLSACVLLAYLLAKRCGVSYSELDAEVLKKAETGIKEKHVLESNYGDLSLLKKHFESGIRSFGQEKKRRI